MEIGEISVVHRDPRLSYFLGGGEGHGADKTNEEVLNVVTSRSIINRSFSRSVSRNVPFEPPLSKRDVQGKRNFVEYVESINWIHIQRVSISEFSTLFFPPTFYISLFVHLHIYTNNNIECKLKINISDLHRHKYQHARREIHRSEIKIKLIAQ